MSDENRIAKRLEMSDDEFLAAAERIKAVMLRRMYRDAMYRDARMVFAFDAAQTEPPEKSPSPLSQVACSQCGRTNPVAVARDHVRCMTTLECWWCEAQWEMPDEDRDAG